MVEESIQENPDSMQRTLFLEVNFIDAGPVGITQMTVCRYHSTLHSWSFSPICGVAQFPSNIIVPRLLLSATSYLPEPSRLDTA